MELGIVINTREKSIEEQLEKAGELGFDFVEIVAVGPRADLQFLEDNFQSIRDTADSNSLDLHLHLPWTFDIASPYEQYREAALHILKELLKIAEKLDIKKATAHPKSTYQYYWDEEKIEEKMINSLVELNEIAEEQGIELVAENVGEFDLLWFDEFLEARNLSMCLDTGHAVLNGYDEEEIIGFVEEHEERVSHFHLNDNRGEEDEHLSLGYGFIDLEKILSSLEEKDWNGSVGIEPFTEDMDYWKISKEKVENWLGRSA